MAHTIFLRCVSLILLSALLTPYSLVSGGTEGCEEDGKKSFIFYRSLVFTGDGPAILNATRAQFANEWGSCFDLDKFGQKMVNFYDSYGLKVDGIRKDPYKYYSTEIYNLLPLIYDNDYRLMMTSLFDFSKFTNSRVHIAAWELRFKKSFKNDKYDIPAGSYIFYGAYRLKLHERDFCLQFNSHSFVGPSTAPYVPLDLDVYSAEWGQGSDQGLITVKTPFTEGFQIRNVLTFPPAKPRNN